MNDKSASQQIDDIITKFSGWKSELIKRLRAIIHDADPQVTEEIKWWMEASKWQWKDSPPYLAPAMLCMLDSV